MQKYIATASTQKGNLQSSFSTVTCVCHTHTHTLTIIPQTEPPSVQHSQLPFVSCVLANFTEFYQSMQDRPSVAPHQTIHFTQTTSPACLAAGFYILCVYVYMYSVCTFVRVCTWGMIKDKERMRHRRTAWGRSGDRCDRHDGHS